MTKPQTNGIRQNLNKIVLLEAPQPFQKRAARPQPLSLFVVVVGRAAVAAAGRWGPAGTVLLLAFDPFGAAALLFACPAALPPSPLLLLAARLPASFAFFLAAMPGALAAPGMGAFGPFGANLRLRYRFDVFLLGRGPP